MNAPVNTLRVGGVEGRPLNAESEWNYTSNCKALTYYVYGYFFWTTYTYPPILRVLFLDDLHLSTPFLPNWSEFFCAVRWSQISNSIPVKNFRNRLELAEKWWFTNVLDRIWFEFWAKILHPRLAAKKILGNTQFRKNPRFGSRLFSTLFVWRKMLWWNFSQTNPIALRHL